MLQTTYDIVTRYQLYIPSIEFTEKAGTRYRNLMWNYFIRGPMFVVGSLGRNFVSNWFVALQYVR